MTADGRGHYATSTQTGQVVRHQPATRNRLTGAGSRPTRRRPGERQRAPLRRGGVAEDPGLGRRADHLELFRRDRWRRGHIGLGRAAGEPGQVLGGVAGEQDQAGHGRDDAVGFLGAAEGPAGGGRCADLPVGATRPRVEHDMCGPLPLGDLLQNVGQPEPPHLIEGRVDVTNDALVLQIGEPKPGPRTGERPDPDRLSSRPFCWYGQGSCGTGPSRG